MAIQPVEYIKNSSTAGFAVAGDEKTITSDNANTIQKDVSQGNTKDLTVAQEKYLDSQVDYDTLDYTDEEMQKSGENKIDTKGEDGESLEEKDQKGGAATSVSTAAAGAAAGAMQATLLAAKVTLSDGYTALILSIIASALGATTLAFSFPSTFDSNLEERKTQTSNAENNNNIINGYVDELNTQMDFMNQNSQKYQEVLTRQTQVQLDRTTRTTALNGNMIELMKQGLPVSDIQKQQESVFSESEEQITADQEELDKLKESFADFTGRNAEAVGVKSSGDTVSQFLKDGSQLAKMAKASAGLSLIAAVGCLAAVPIPKIWVGIIPVDAVAAGAAKIMFIAAGLAFGYAANNFKSRAEEEGAAADAGNGMAGNLATLGDYIDSHSQTYDAASTGFAEQEAASAEQVANAEENAQAANNGGQAPSTRTGKKPTDKKPPTNNAA